MPNENSDVIVSVFMITYNHEKYIAEALDSILMQEVDFRYEIVVGDDCSTDNTRQILLEYKEKFPDKFKLLLHDENIGMIANMIATLRACTGEYIALCEGDDYWIDSKKLQKQVDFLNKYQQVSMLFENALIKEYDENGNIQNTAEHTMGIENGIVQPIDILSKKIVPTASVLFRNRDLESFFEKIKNFPVGDTPLFLYLAKFGDIYYQNEITSVYRILDSGTVKSTLGSVEASKAFVNYFRELDVMFRDFGLSIKLKELISLRYGYLIKRYIHAKDYVNAVKYFFILVQHDPMHFLNYLRGKISSGVDKNDVI